MIVDQTMWENQGKSMSEFLFCTASRDPTVSGTGRVVLLNYPALTRQLL